MAPRLWLQNPSRGHSLDATFPRGCFGHFASQVVPGTGTSPQELSWVPRHSQGLWKVGPSGHSTPSCRDHSTDVGSWSLAVQNHQRMRTFHDGTSQQNSRQLNSAGAGEQSHLGGQQGRPGPQSERSCFPHVVQAFRAHSLRTMTLRAWRWGQWDGSNSAGQGQGRWKVRVSAQDFPA